MYFDKDVISIIKSYHKDIYNYNSALTIINDYFKTFPQLYQWIEDNKNFIEANGFIYSFFGRKRRLPNVMSTDRGIRSHEVRSGLNFLVQSAASDINLLGAIDANQLIKSKNMEAKIFALVHDSILAEVPENEIYEYVKILKSCVQKDRGLSIPGTPIGCDFDIGQDYSMGKFEDKYDSNL